MTLKTVAQKLVAIESLSAKTASGAMSAAQNLSRPLLVPKMKIDASGRNTSGNIMNTSMPMLRGRTTSNPRTCRIAGAIVLITVSSLALHLSDENLLDHVRISLGPTVEVFNGERNLDVTKIRVCFIKSLVCRGIKVKLYERLLRFVAPEILHKRINYLTLVSGDVLVNRDRGMFAENGSSGHHDLDRCICLFHQERVEFVSDQRIAVAEFERSSRFAC